MSDLSDAQSALTAKIVGANPTTGAEDFFLAVDSSGRPTVNLNDGASTIYGPATSQAGVNALPIAIAANNYVFSTANSTTVQLAAGATFTGTIENLLNQPSYSILITSDQPGTLTLLQYIDAGGTRISQSLKFQVLAGVGFSRSGVVNGNYFSLTFKNDGASTTTTLNINTAYGNINAASQLNNMPVSIQEINGVPVGGNSYSAAATAFASAGSATDVFRIVGSATKTIRITRVEISGTTTAGSGISVSVGLIKRSTANTGGTSVATNIVPHDSQTAAATATVNHYTANPSGLGTAVGAIRSTRSTFATAGSVQLPTVWEFGNINSQSVVLRGTAEQLCVNFSATTVTGPLISISVTWTED